MFFFFLCVNAWVALPRPIYALKGGSCALFDLLFMFLLCSAGIESRVWLMLGKHCTTEPSHPHRDLEFTGIYMTDTISYFLLVLQTCFMFAYNARYNNKTHSLINTVCCNTTKTESLTNDFHVLLISTHSLDVIFWLILKR